MSPRSSAQLGTVTLLQHFGSTPNLDMNFHLLALDGIYEAQGESEPLAFIRVPTPIVAQLERLVERVARRILAMVVQFAGFSYQSARRSSPTIA